MLLSPFSLHSVCVVSVGWLTRCALLLTLLLVFVGVSLVVFGNWECEAGLVIGKVLFYMVIVYMRSMN